MTGEDPTLRQICCEVGVCASPVPESAPSLEPEAPTTADDLVVGRANLAQQIAWHVALDDLPFAAITVTPTGVEFQTPDYRAAVFVAEVFGAVPQDDRREVVTGGVLNVHESWASDVLRVSWCKRLETAQ